MSPRGGRRAGVGRKPKPPEERRAQKITVALTPLEFADLLELADGEPLALYVRGLVVRLLERRGRARRR